METKCLQNSEYSVHVYAFQYFFPFLFIVFWLRRKANCSYSLQDGIGLFQVGCSSRGSCSLQQFSWQATSAIQTSYQLGYAGRRPGLLGWFCWSILENKLSLGNILVGTGWQTQTWKSSKECYCLKPSQVWFQRELCWGAGCHVSAWCCVNQCCWSTAHTLTSWTS